MWTDGARVLDDVSPAGWLAERLSGPIGTVLGTVPEGFAGYARVFHPVDPHDGSGPVTWAGVAGRTGRTFHPTAQWHALIGAADPYADESELWTGGRPEQGNLVLPQLQALCDTLEPHTSTPEDCFFAMWEGWGSHNGSSVRITLAEDGSGGAGPVPPLYTVGELTSQRLALPMREYLLLRGPLSAMSAIARYDGPEAWWTQSPSIFWPADRSWCVATEIDFDSTLVGGSAEAVADVLARRELEALPVGAADSLRSDADQVNR